MGEMLAVYGSKNRFFSNLVGEKDSRIPGAKGSRGSFTTIRID
jgi:hypothetical protein